MLGFSDRFFLALGRAKWTISKVRYERAGTHVADERAGVVANCWWNVVPLWCANMQNSWETQRFQNQLMLVLFSIYRSSLVSIHINHNDNIMLSHVSWYNNLWQSHWNPHFVHVSRIGAMILAGRQLVRRAAESHRRFASDPWQAPWLLLPRLKKIWDKAWFQWRWWWF